MVVVVVVVVVFLVAFEGASFFSGEPAAAVTKDLRGSGETDVGHVVEVSKLLKVWVFFVVWLEVGSNALKAASMIGLPEDSRSSATSN